MSHREVSSGARRFGYLITILVNFALIYAAQNLLNWNVPFLTNRFTECLWAINLSLGATIFVNFIFLVFDRRWFRSLMQSFTNVFSFISGYVFWRVFPLQLPENIVRWVNLALIILLVLILLSILTELLNAIKFYRRESKV